MRFSSKRRRALAALAAAGATGLTGCAPAPKPGPPLPAPRPPPAAPPPPPTALSASVIASTNVNPDIRGRPSPVTVRVYTLKRRAAFDTADFFALYEKDKDILASDLVDRDEFQLMPGATQQIDKPLSTDIAFVAVFAAFRDLERARWRDVMAIIPRRTNSLRIRLDQTNIVIERAN